MTQDNPAPRRTAAEIKSILDDYFTQEQTARAAAVPAYTYRARVTRWVDGDTADATIDLGFDVWVKTRFRLHGIDTPERGRPGYREATEHNQAIAGPQVDVVVETFKTADKYGRWLAIIHLSDGTTINDRLIWEELAIPYQGGTKKTTTQ